MMTHEGREGTPFAAHAVPPPEGQLVQKLRSYNGRYDFSGCASFFPISIEAGGRWHPQSREHVERYIRWCIGNGDDKAIDKALYNESLRDVTVSVGRALASYQASTVLAAAGKQAAW